MSWVKLDDSFFENPKISILSDPAKVAYLEGLTYCAKELTDGFVPHKRAVGFAGKPRIVQELVPHLWEPVDGGFRVHDYLQYQKTRAEVLAERDAARQRMSGVRSGNVRPNNDTNIDGSSDAPLPIPLPSDHSSSTPASTEERASPVGAGPTRRNLSMVQVEEMLSELSEEFPRVDVKREFAKAGDWLKANNRRKSDYLAFVRNWFRKAEEEARGREPISAAPRPPSRRYAP